MKSRKWIVMGCLALIVTVLRAGELKLWYDKPARQWVEALPLGNGAMGAMVFGEIGQELIQLNEATLWSGGPRKDQVNPGAYENLAPLREALFQGDIPTATAFCRKMQGNYTESFLPMGDLHIEQSLYGANAKEYYRDLNLQTAIATTRFTVNGVKYVREAFVSAPDSVMVIRFTTSKKGSLDLKFSLSSLLQNQVLRENEALLCMTGKAPACVDPSYYNPRGRESIVWEDPEGCNGMRFCVAMEVQAKGGTVTTLDSAISIQGASEVLLLLSSSTSFNGMDKSPLLKGKNERDIALLRLRKARQKVFKTLEKNHIKDYVSYFNRCTLSLGEELPPCTLPSDERLKAHTSGTEDLALEALYFQYGRYLLISCSRPGGIPANLQGLWNKELRAPWSSNYTININTEMNYWPAEVTNLSEMHEPLLDWIANLSKNGAKTAREYYNCRGWVAHHNSDLWGLSNAVGNCGDGDPTWANWYMGGNWLCQHLWEHYSFTKDKEYLREKAYPVMKEAALFCLDWLVEDSDGFLVTAPSTSPENTFKMDGKNYSVSVASTMDMAIIHDLFTNLIEATEELDTDTDFRKLLIEKRGKLFPYQIGSKGELQEWSKEYVESDPHHRHVSHLFGLHPGRQISPAQTPQWAGACRRTLELRGDEGTGWSKAWKINFWARLQDGNHAYRMVRDIMHYTNATGGVTGGGTYPNFFDAHPPFQIDGNFGATAGMAEMLLQSHLGEIQLLPALPSAWTKGKVMGLKARGGYTVDLEWEGNELKEAVVSCKTPAICKIRYGTQVKEIALKKGKNKISF